MNGERENNDPLIGDRQLAVLMERLKNFMSETANDRNEVHNMIAQLQAKVDEWITVTSTRLPIWAVWVGWMMALSIGSMAMWILTHAGRL